MGSVIGKEITGKQFNKLRLKPVKVLENGIKHYDFQYQLGLNIDHNKFNPSGNCEAGGLYFTFPKYLVNFINYGNRLFQVTIPDDARVYCESKNKFKADKIIINEIELEDLDSIKDLKVPVQTYNKLSKKPNLDVIKYFVEEAEYKEFPDAIRRASEKGHLEIVKYLIEVAKYKEDPIAIIMATEGGHLEIVKYLIEEAKYKEDRDAIRSASWLGHLEILKYLIEEAKYKKDPYAIRVASERGHLDIVKYLVEEAKYKKDPYAIIRAVKGSHFEIVKYLCEEAKYDVHDGIS